MEILVGVVVGIVSGLITSLMFWYVQFRVFRVKLELSPLLAKYRLTGDSVDRYQLKVRNVGRRDALDLQLVVRCAVRGLVHRDTTETLPLREWSAPVMSAGREGRWRVNPGRMPESTRIGYWKYFTPSIRAALDAGLPIDLKQFFDLGAEAELRVYLSATDALSGSRSIVSRTYTARDVRAGRFIEGSFDHSDPEPAGLLAQPTGPSTALPRAENSNESSNESV